jgi:hypothetical protein
MMAPDQEAAKVNHNPEGMEFPTIQRGYCGAPPQNTGTFPGNIWNITPAPQKTPAQGRGFRCCEGIEPVYFVISTSLVSGRKKMPITQVIKATMIGYHRPL